MIKKISENEKISSKSISLEMGYVLVSYSCHKKAPQTEWLRTTGICRVSILESSNLKSVCQ